MTYQKRKLLLCFSYVYSTIVMIDYQLLHDRGNVQNMEYSIFHILCVYYIILEVAYDAYIGNCLHYVYC